MDQIAKLNQDPRNGLGHTKCNTLVIPNNGSKKNKDFTDFLQRKKKKYKCSFLSKLREDTHWDKTKKI